MENNRFLVLLYVLLLVIALIIAMLAGPKPEILYLPFIDSGA